MAFVKKTWKDRIAEFPTRRRLTKSNGDSELVTVAREEGTLSQEGDAFSAENMNDLERRVDDAISEINSNLSWKVGNTSVGKNGVDLPSNYNELLIAFDDGTEYKRTNTIYLPKISFNNIMYFYTVNAYAHIENNKVYLDFFKFGDNEVTNTTRTTIYYR